MKNLFLREVDDKGRESVVFAKEGTFSLADNKRTLELSNGYRYNGIPGQADFNEVSRLKHLSLVISVTPKVVNAIDSRKTIPTADLFGSSKPEYQGELLCVFIAADFGVDFEPAGDSALVFQPAHWPHL